MNRYLTQQHGPKLSSTIVEIKLDSQTGKYYLPDDAILRDKCIVGVFLTENPDDDRVAPNSSRPLAPEITIRNAFLTLSFWANHFLDDHPLIALQVGKDDKEIPHVYSPKGFTPTKSFVRVADATNKVTIGDSILLHFIYINNEWD